MYSVIKKLHPNIKARLFISFITKLHTTAILSILPIFLSGKASVIYISIIMTILVGSNIFGKFIGGILGDKYQKKLLLVRISLSEILIYISLLYFLFVDKDNIIMLGILFILNAFMSSMKGPIIDSILLDSITKEERANVFTINYWLFNLSLSFSFVLAGFVFNGVMIHIVLFGTICHIISAFCIYYFIHEVDSVSDISTKRKKSFSFGYGIILLDKRFMVYCIGMLLVLGVEFQLPNYIAVYLNKNFNSIVLGYDINGIKMLSLIQLINSILIVLLPLVLNKFIDLDNPFTFMVGIVAYSIGYAMLLLTDNFNLLVLLAVLFSIGEMLYYPIKQVILAEIVPKESQTKYMAFHQIITHASRIIGTFGLTLFSFINIYFVSIIIFMLGILGGIMIYLPRNNKYFSKKQYECNSLQTKKL